MIDTYADANTDADEGLRSQSLRGGTALAVRELIGMSVRIGGIVVVTRLIGPGDYGVYAGAVALVMFATMAGQLGTEAYLARLEGPVPRERYDEAFSFVLVLSSLCAIVTLAIAPLLRFVGSDFVVVVQVLAVTIPINALWAPAQARIERDLRYREMAAIELVGDIVLYGVAISVALVSPTAWAPVAGFAAWQTWLLLASLRVSGLRPRWRWSPGSARDFARYGTGYTFSSWTMTRSLELMNPLIVGPAAGVAAVGQVAVALRIVESLGFVSRAARRIALVTFGRVQTDGLRFAWAIDDASVLQVLALGAPLAGFAFLAREVVEPVFGDEWHGVVSVYPWIALALLVGSPFMIHAYALHVMDRNATVVVAALVALALLVLVSPVLVARLGAPGFGYARLASIVGLGLLAPRLHRLVPFDLRRVLPWLIAFAPVIAATNAPAVVRVCSLLPAVAVLSTSSAREQLRGFVSALRARKAIA